MTLPTCYGWYPVNHRLFVPYEAPQGRRVNGIGLVLTHGPDAGQFAFALRAKLPEERHKKVKTPLAEQAQRHGVRPEDVGALDTAFVIAFIWTAVRIPAKVNADFGGK